MAYDIIHIAGQPHFLIPVHEYTKMQGNSEGLPKAVREELALGKTSPIKILRKARCMTQGDLAAAANLSRPYLTEIETGRKDGSIRALKAIAEALNVSLDILVN